MSIWFWISIGLFALIVALVVCAFTQIETLEKRVKSLAEHAKLRQNQRDDWHDRYFELKRNIKALLGGIQ